MSVMTEGCGFGKPYPFGSRSSGESEHDRRMLAIGLMFVRMLSEFFRLRQQLEAEILVLRHQLNILQQRAPRRPHLPWADRPGSTVAALASRKAAGRVTEWGTPSPAARSCSGLPSRSGPWTGATSPDGPGRKTPGGPDLQKCGWPLSGTEACERMQQHACRCEAYSTASSARNRIEAGRSVPSSLAVLRLIEPGGLLDRYVAGFCPLDRPCLSSAVHPNWAARSASFEIRNLLQSSMNWRQRCCGTPIIGR
jgi:hypothetical protein